MHEADKHELRCTHTVERWGLDVTDLSFGNNGRILASSSIDGTIRLWDLESSAEISRHRVLGHELHNLSLSPDGRRLATSANDGIRVWDTSIGRIATKIVGVDININDIALSPDGKLLATCSNEKSLQYWDTATGSELFRFAGNEESLNCMKFRFDGRVLVCGRNDGVIVAFDAETNRELARLNGHADPIYDIQLSPDGTRFVSISRPQSGQIIAKLWSTNPWAIIATIEPKWSHEFMPSAAFSRDGKLLALGDGSAEATTLWNGLTGLQIDFNPTILAAIKAWLNQPKMHLLPDSTEEALNHKDRTYLVYTGEHMLDLFCRLKTGLLNFSEHDVLDVGGLNEATPMLHVDNDILAQLANPNLIPERRAELQMQLCAKSGQLRAATSQWQALQRGEWPGFEQAIVPKDQAPATIIGESPIRCHYLITLIDATKHPQIHGHPTICLTAAQIAQVLTKEMMARPTISLAMMSLMQNLAKDDSVDMSAPRAALMNRLAEVASKQWLAELHVSAGIAK